MKELTSKGVPPNLPPEEWEWPCPGGCGTKKDSFKKFHLTLLMIFLTGFQISALSLIVGGSTPPQGQSSIGATQVCPSCPPCDKSYPALAGRIFEWTKTVGWKRFWAPVLAAIGIIFVWKGGSIRIKGRGLVSGAARKRGE